MAEQEGVVRYHVEHEDGPTVDAPGLAVLDEWRTVLHREALVGQRPDRYDGYGYGNVSLRDEPGFVISGTQTGRPERLGPAGYARVLAADVAGNRLVSAGPVRPSSEALTHAACYQADPEIGCVLHIHAPALWHAAKRLGLPMTDPSIAYGTPAMAGAVADALALGPPGSARVVAMGGHEDGVLAVGVDANAAGEALLAAVEQADELR